MDVVSISSPVVAASSLSSGTTTALTSAANDSATTVDTGAAASGDTVTLSQAAQRVLAAGSSATADGSAPPDALTQAIAVLNDTSGTVSVADQLQAYGLVAQAADAFNNSAYNTSTPAALAALAGSPFGQHAQQLLSQIGGIINNNGNYSPDSRDAGLAAFNNLSTTDQQIYVGMVGMDFQMEGGQTPISTVADYQANQAAQANVDCALQAAFSNPAYSSALSSDYVAQDGNSERFSDLAGLASAAGDTATAALANLMQATTWAGGSNPEESVGWTQEVQAYFATYGAPAAPVTTTAAPSSAPVAPPTDSPTPDGTTLATAVAAMYDTTGQVPFADQVSAYQTLMAYIQPSSGAGPAEAAVANLFLTSPFYNQVNSTSANFFWDPAVMSAMGGNTTDPSQSVVALLDKLPQQQQELIFLGNNYGLTDINAWKAELAKNEAYWTAYNAANPSPTPSSTNGVTVSAATAASIAQSNAVASAGTKALAILTAPASNSSDAAIALTVLQSAAKATAKAKAARDQAASVTANSSATVSATDKSGTANQQKVSVMA